MTRQQRLTAFTIVGGVLAALLIYALFAAVRTETPATASPSPTATASESARPSATAAATSAAPSATGSPVASPAAASRYGYVTVGGGGFAIVDESGKTIQQHPCGVPGRGCGGDFIAISPDGRRVAFFGAGQAQGWVIRALEVSDPGVVKVVATLPDGVEGTSLAWATDSRGLLYAAQTIGYGGIRGGAGKATLSGIDVTTQAPAVEVMPTQTDGTIYRPLTWDRTKNIVAAVTTGEGGFVGAYALKEGDRYTTTRAPVQMIAGQVEASPDGANVLGVDMANNALRIWQVGSFATQDQIRPAQAGAFIRGAHWKSSREVGWAYGGRFDVFRIQSDDIRTVYKADSGEVTLIAFRPDGTAALLAAGGQPNVSVAVLNVDTATGSVLSRPAMEVTQLVERRGVLLR